MIEKLVATFIEFQTGLGTIQDDDVNVYRYAYTLMVEVVLNISFSILLGFLLGSIKEVIFFLCMFIPLRSFGGGYHADKAWKCIVLSNLVVMAVIIISKIVVSIEIPIFLRSIITIILALFIFLFAPIENENKRIDIKEKKILKGCSTIVIVMELIIEAFLIHSGMRRYCDIVLLSFIVQLVFMNYSQVSRHNY